MSARNILIAVGGWPYKPEDVPGIEHAITSNEVFYLDKQPRCIVIVGGGFIALEFTCIMDGLGSEVKLMYQGDLFLRGFNMDMRVHLREEMERNTNVKLMFITDPGEISKRDDGTLVVTDRDGNKVMCDMVMYATGRRGKIDSQNLHDPAVGVRTTETGNFVPVDDYSQKPPERVRRGRCNEQDGAHPLFILL